ncbi:hypothetical protein [Caenispirillum salinarum]|uniref:hypothetical protein n=1 Tax=Caenispirillum salinarum TaxID=859058 RepID=UPI00384EB7A3
MGFVNRGIANTLGAPADLVNAGLNTVGLGSEQPFGGSESIRAGMGYLGIETPDRAPETMGEYVAAGTGEAAGALLPVGATARAASGLKGMAGTLSRDMMNTAARRPVATLGTEMTAGAGAGAGRYVGEMNSDDPTIRTGAELVGGLAGAMAPGAAVSAVTRAPVTGTAIRMGKAAVVPFTESGAKVRASRRIREVAEQSPEEINRALDAPNDYGLDPATRTGDEGLIGLRQSVMDENPPLRREGRDRLRQAEAEMRADIEGDGGSIEATRQFLAREREAATQALRNRMQQAEARAQQRLADLSPQRARSESSAIFREELTAALKDARAQERRLWQMVPDDVTVPTEAARTRYEVLVADLPRAQRDDMPEAARRFLERGGNDAFGDAETVKEVRGLRSRLLDDARKARAAGEMNQARLADDLADALLDDLAAPGAGSAAFDEARRFSALVNRTFRQGPAGRVLGYAREGGDRVAPELTLHATMGRGGETGAAQARDMMGAFEGDLPSARAPAARGAMEDYLKAQFADTAVRNGRLDLNAARRFATANDETLRQFPELRRSMLSARSAQAVADIAGQATRGQTARVDDPVTRFLNAAPDQEIAALAKARNPAAAAQTIRARAQMDRSGVALRGAQSAMADFLLTGATRGGALSGDALSRLLADGRTGTVARELLTPDQLKRLERVAGELRKVEVAREARGNAGPVMDDAPNRVIDMLGRTLGARWGAQAGQGTSGASLLTANFASQNVRRLLERLTNDKAAQLVRDAIVNDPDLLRALLADASTPATAEAVARKLNAWLAGPAVNAMPGRREEQQAMPTQPLLPAPKSEPEALAEALRR